MTKSRCSMSSSTRIDCVSGVARTLSSLLSSKTGASSKQNSSNSPCWRSVTMASSYGNNWYTVEQTCLILSRNAWSKHLVSMTISCALTSQPQIASCRKLLRLGRLSSKRLQSALDNTFPERCKLQCTKSSRLQWTKLIRGSIHSLQAVSTPTTLKMARKAEMLTKQRRKKQ